MRVTNRSRLSTAFVLACIALGAAGCSTTNNPFSPQAPAAPEPQAAPQLPLMPPRFPAQDIVGRWGLAAYHKDEDRPRIEAAAAQQCRQPYVITLGPTGGVMMHQADQSQPTELALKGAPGGRTFIGPASDPPGSQQDREAISFDGRILVLRWMDPEVQGRYGTMVYVRCPAEGQRRPPAKPKPKPRTQAAPAPATRQPPVQQAPAQ